MECGGIGPRVLDEAGRSPDRFQRDPGLLHQFGFAGHHIRVCRQIRLAHGVLDRPARHARRFDYIFPRSGVIGLGVPDNVDDVRPSAICR